jgi:hypothetical protein
VTLSRRQLLSRGGDLIPARFSIQDSGVTFAVTGPWCESYGTETGESSGAGAGGATNL